VLRQLRGGRARRALIVFAPVRRAAPLFRTVLRTDSHSRSPVMEPKSVDRLFWDAAQMASAGEREAYLDRACADDPELRRRVEQLLQARSKAESFLESPAPNLVATADEPASERPAAVVR